MKRSPAYLRAPGAGLQDDWRANLGGGCHHGLHLFEIVHVEGGNAVAVLGSMVEQLAHRNEGHGGLLM